MELERLAQMINPIDWFALLTKSNFEKTVQKSIANKNIEVFLPSISEQRKLSRVISLIDEKIYTTEVKKKALENLFKSMLHNLMSAKIRVNDLVMPNGRK